MPAGRDPGGDVADVHVGGCPMGKRCTDGDTIELLCTEADDVPA